MSNFSQNGRKYIYMKIENLKIGNTYYLPARYQPHNYTYGVLIEIVSKKKVILENKRGQRFSCSTDKLHKSPDKAVVGRKAQERARHQMKKMEQREREKLVDKNVQNKIKKLGHSTYAAIEHKKFIVVGYNGSPRFNTLEELEIWADAELEKLSKRIELINAKDYKFLRVVGKNEKVQYYKIINITFKKFEIHCKQFNGDNIEIKEENVLDRTEVSDMKMVVIKGREGIKD